MMEIESLKRSDVLYKNVLDLFVFQDEMHSTLVQALRTGKQTVHAKQTYHNYNGKKSQRLTIHTRSFETV